MLNGEVSQVFDVDWDIHIEKCLLCVSTVYRIGFWLYWAVLFDILLKLDAFNKNFSVKIFLQAEILDVVDVFCVARKHLLKNWFSS